MDEGLGDGTATIVDRSSSWEDFLNSRYKKEMEKIRREYPKLRSLYLDYSVINAYGKKGHEFVDQLDQDPKRVLREIKDCILANHMIFPRENKGDITIRIVNVTRKKSIRSLTNDDVDTFVSIEGMVRKSTQKGSQRCMVAAFRCPVGHRTRIPQTIGQMKEPDRCSSDGCKNKRFEFVEADSEFKDVQKIRIQEFPEGLVGGDQPATIDVDILDDICNKVKPGDRVVVTGIVKRINKSSTHQKSSGFNLYIECNSIEQMQIDFKDISYCDSDILEIQKIASDPEVYSLVSQSIAPAVIGNDRVKFALALQLFGGVVHRIGQTRKRGDLHVLITGDPGIAKSVLLNYVYLIAPRAVKVSGEAATGVGLTGAAVKDEFGEGSWTIEAGALSIADNGICIVDEFGRMSKQSQGALHNAMEGEQEVNIAKAGVSSTLKTRTAILAAQNPREGRWNDMLSIAENIDIPASLVSRFDLIFVLKDIPEFEYDSMVANHMMNSLIEDTVIEPKISIELFRKYIAYAKTIEPKFTRESASIITEYYPAVRGASTGPNKAMPITPRQFDSAIRIAEALARIQLSPVVTMDHSILAIKTLNECLKEVAYDPVTGITDLEGLMTGKTRQIKDLIKVMYHAAEQLGFGSAAPIDESEFILGIQRQGYDEHTVRSRLTQLKRNGNCYTPKFGQLKFIKGDWE